ncbi:MAG TPA: PorP/SprF family type IX secretion system membrane protein [Bacteroidales bacterium]|nr:PorP/SprF family type IX secretion system membrane protein [Bacteroidales bacterium]HOL97553.1 PorP/SprF family type IX secretion system membrane protein [Bacteroidales bacterium]HOM35821.1 PorP/SprF family type IX secretion system membrane protein [Bacteroidales bacterium]HPD22961.1 PorP/SprF family type IX secretion system membrane protein [Bacteroidales bacterium]HRS98800.1 PorP/SprF family type IX secretion system membrane protein [Bacteroidales bacterium]
MQKLNKIYLFTILTVISFCSRVFAQDIHFSQFFAAPLFTNPANTGLFDGDLRFVLNQKNQWNSFTNAYRTFGGSVDAAYKINKINYSESGSGILLNQDIAGDGRFSTTQIYLNSALRFKYGNNNKFKTGIGIQIGYTFHSINFNNFTFGEQYDGEQFDPNRPSNEVWDFNRFNYLDFGSGIVFSYNHSPKLDVGVSISANHINRPKRTFLENSNSILPVKWTLNFFGEYNFKDDLWIEPLILYHQQQKYTELNLGGILRFNYNPLSFQSFSFGLLLRARDAGIVVFGLNYNNLRFFISYDINISKLSAISKGRGGTEFSLIYIFSKIRPFDAPHYRKCPDFI